MIYDYYCMNCGHKLAGNNILFDLAQMLDLHSETDASALFIPFNPEDLKNKAKEMNVSSEGKICLEITLKDILEYMSRDLDRGVERETIRKMVITSSNMEEWKDPQLITICIAG